MKKIIDEFSSLPAWARVKARKRRDGICQRCKRKALAGRTMCEEHRKENNIFSKKRNRVNTRSYIRYYLAKRKFGITKDQYDFILKSQNGLCAICSSIPCNRSLSLDHDHATGKARGFLCNSCNMALGHIKDNPNIALSIASYLDKHKPLA